MYNGLYVCERVTCFLSIETFYSSVFKADPTVTVTTATATAVTTITDTATILTAAATGDFTLD